jgi:hypothetical protein
VKFSVTLDTASVVQKLRRARVAFATKQRDALEAVGVAVLSRSQLDYRTKSRGGTGTDGIKWEPLKPATVKAKSRRGRKQANRATTKSGKPRPTGNATAIGINLGLQLSSASPGFRVSNGGNIFRLTNTDITVGYGMKYSQFFDELRPLLPEKLPPVWREEAQAIVNRWAEQIVKDAINGR